ncbi:unnamed protein product [Effrenium voratum]|uniref:Aspartyl/asparaginy/proline hydroxylase domain-containing protein n=1 Tax=Effrenium voratum TaxID=2562239 RepID=A0AA36N3S9_9DINO|nr:unnamed protein product [Effrenium voratum]
MREVFLRQLSRKEDLRPCDLLVPVPGGRHTFEAAPGELADFGYDAALAWLETTWARGDQGIDSAGEGQKKQKKGVAGVRVAEHFPWMAKLELHWRDIHAELLRTVQNEWPEETQVKLSVTLSVKLSVKLSEMGGQRLLVDPLLVGSLVFWGQTWAFKGQRRFQGPLPTPEEVFGSYDAIVLSQGLEDHYHLPTLERIDRRMPIIANAAAAQTAEGLGFRPKVLRPGESLMLGQLRISALPGSVVGPPWQDPENGYVFEDTRPKGWSVGLEPHGNFRGPALGTSLRKLPKSPPHRLDALILPLTAQEISGYKLVNGADEAADTLEALDPVPRFVLPLRNAEIEAKGVLAELLREDGSQQRFRQLQRERPKLANVQLLDLPPGEPVTLEHGVWREFPLLGLNAEVQESCPKTWQLLTEVEAIAQHWALCPDEETALFSRLTPGTRLKPHCGPSNLHLTCHLGLQVPQGCSIRVGDEWRSWQEGRCLVFDDSYEHEVRHDGDAPRFVLLLRFWHPQVRPEMRRPLLAAKAKQRKLKEWTLL